MATVNVTWDLLKELAGVRAVRGCAISFYLGLDPSVSPTPADLHTRTNALVDEANRQAESSRCDRGHAEQEAIRAGLERIRGYVENEFARDGAHGLAIFSASSDEVWRPLPLPVAVRDVVRLKDDLFLTPLVPLVGRGGGAVVAYVGRERGDLYELRDGRLEEIASRFEEQPRRHDQGGWSQANYQRRVDNLALAHLRDVADDLEREVRRRRAAQVVIACSEETRADLAGMLSADVRAALAGWTPAEAHATGPELLQLVQPVLDRTRADDGAAAAARWREEVGRDGRGSAGWEPTLEAASDGRIELLLYEPGVDRAVWSCPSCGRLAAAEGVCPLDGSELEPRPDGLDLVLHRTLARGGTALELDGLRDLEPVGGIGAVLRF
jgi:peptide chain release factor subunit 1